MLKSRKKLYYAIIILIPLLFFSPLLISDSIMTFGDGIGYEAQFETIRAALKEGQFPQWNHFIANGTPFLADIQNKAFYPFVYLCLLFPQHMDYKIFYLLHIILNAVFCFSLFDNLTKNEYAAFYGAVASSFCNMIILRQDHINILCTIVWIPLLIQILIRLCESHMRKYAAYLGIVMALQFLAGFPQLTFYFDIILALIYIFLNIKRHTKTGIFLINGLIIVISYIGLIAVQILPLAELMLYSGRSNISYDYFSNGASDYRFLLNLINPVFWGQWGSLLYQELEFPTDMYIGIIPLTLFIYSLIYCRNKYEIRVLSCVALIAFILACACNNIPILGRLLYKLPLINSFRTLSRFLIFVSGSLIWMGVIGLKHVIENNAYHKMKIISICILTVYLFLCCIFINLGKIEFFLNNAWNEHFSSFEWCYKSIVVLIVTIILWSILEKSKRLYTGKSFPLVITILIISLWDTYFYNTDPSAEIFRQSGMLAYGSHNDHFETEETAFLASRPDMDRQKYFVSYESWNDLERTSWGVRVNGNVYHNLSSIQSYITFNNPLLLKICNTDYGMMMTVDSVMALTNPTFLQMLSVKYIIVDNQYNYAWNGTSIVFEQYPMEKNDKTDNYISIPINLNFDRANTINLHINVLEGEGTLSIMLENEVLNTQDLISGDNYIKYTLPTGDRQAAPLKLLFTGFDMNSVDISGIRIEENCEIDNNAIYQEVFKNANYTIVESIYAQPLIYSPQRVISIENSGDYVAENKSTIDFVRDSYIENGNNMNLSEVNTQIEIIDITTNSVTANIYADSSTWVNFSQTPYRGWDVYIDGKKQKSVPVNGLIQGTPVEAGNHIVTFRFSSPMLFWGGIISMVAWVAVILFIVYENRRSKNVKTYRSTNVGISPERR